MRQAKRWAALLGKWGGRALKSGSVCPHCGASTTPGSVYFVLACIFIGCAAGLVGQYVANLQWKPVIEQFQNEIRQPFPLHPSP